MKLSTTQDIYQFLRMYIPSTALNVALQQGIFWQLSEKPCTPSEIARSINIPVHRCQVLLDLLHKLGLLDKHDNNFSVSSVTQRAILEGYSADTWKFLAEEMQKHNPLLVNLGSNFSYPDSLWEKQESPPSNWFQQMKQDPDYARKFTYGLYEFHLSFAQIFAQNFDMSGVNCMMDIGGGSGVMSLELLKRHPRLLVTVIDIANVCMIGKEIAEKTKVKNRIKYSPLDFSNDTLPTGFDLILQCDAGNFSVEFFTKLRSSLSPHGRLVIITNIDDDSAWLYHPDVKISLYKTVNRFISSLEIASKPRQRSTIDTVKHSLLKADFQEVTHDVWETGEVIIQAFN